MDQLSGRMVFYLLDDNDPCSDQVLVSRNSATFVNNVQSKIYSSREFALALSSKDICLYLDLRLLNPYICYIDCFNTHPRPRAACSVPCTDSPSFHLNFILLLLPRLFLHNHLPSHLPHQVLFPQRMHKINPHLEHSFVISKIINLVTLFLIILSTLLLSYHQLSPAYKYFILNLTVLQQPKSYTEAMSHVEWQQAMDVEMVSLPPGKQSIWSAVNVCIKLNIRPMERLKGIEQGQLPRVTHKTRVLTI